MKQTISLLIMLALVSGCQSLPTHRINHQVLADERQIIGNHRVVILPLAVKVKELSLGGFVGEVGGWTRQAKSSINHALPAVLESAGNIELVTMPAQLSEEERQTIDEHLALYDVVAANAVKYSGQAAWQHKMAHFDYTLGPGLAFLKEKSGADHALLIAGEDVISSNGRKGAFVVAAAFRIALPMGHSLFIGGLVDLETGDILWLNQASGSARDTFLEASDVEEMLTALYLDYPGIESYQKALNR